MKCLTLAKTLIILISILAILSPFLWLGAISHAEAPDSPVLVNFAQKVGLLEANLTPISWQNYLRDRVFENGLEIKDFNRLKECFRRESNWRQYDRSGKVLTGTVHSPDLGIAQINSAVWQEAADLIGYDLKDPYGNLNFGLWLYTEQGIRPWVACKKL